MECLIPLRYVEWVLMDFFLMTEIEAFETLLSRKDTRGRVDRLVETTENFWLVCFIGLTEPGICDLKICWYIPHIPHQTVQIRELGLFCPHTSN